MNLCTMKQTDLCTFAFRREWTKEKEFSNCRNFTETEILRHDTFHFESSTADSFQRNSFLHRAANGKATIIFFCFSKIMKIRVLLKALKKIDRVYREDLFLPTIYHFMLHCV